MSGAIVKITVGPFRGQLAEVVRVRPGGGLGIRLIDHPLYRQVMHYRTDEVESAP